jgi:DNA-binding Lrp family transcriptional regulator
MQRNKLDAIDRRILHELQAEGRITNVELSQRAKISAPPCLRRVRALEQDGYIRGYHADLDPKALGYEVTKWPIVRECTMMSGEVDYVLKCVAHDLGEWQSFITDTLTAAKSVGSVKTALAIREAKREPGVPVEV